MKTHELTVYGISNCDTVRQARQWLTQQGIAHRFHDFKKSGVPEAALTHWLEALGHQALVNRRGTTWRKLDPASQARVVDDVSAHRLLLLHPSAIKRPVVEWPGAAARFTAGFDAQVWDTQHSSLPNA